MITSSAASGGDKSNNILVFGRQTDTSWLTPMVCYPTINRYTRQGQLILQLSTNCQTRFRMIVLYMTPEEITAQLRKTPSKSSPGIDSLAYELLRLLSNHRLLLIYWPVSAMRFWSRKCFLLLGNFSVVVLLPKSGDCAELKNWRPISLICADAKLFTRSWPIVYWQLSPLSSPNIKQVLFATAISQITT